MKNYHLLQEEGARPIKAWVNGVELEAQARAQLFNAAKLPIVSPWVAVMPDVHWGIGATVGSVIPTKKAIIPAAVGVDIGCGMMAVKTSLRGEDLPDDLRELRTRLEKAVPSGSAKHNSSVGAWTNPQNSVLQRYRRLEKGLEKILDSHPILKKHGARPELQLGTLGGGNHFLEVCLDESNAVWIMLHSGSRGIGNKIGTYFIELAKRDMQSVIHNLPDKDLAYFSEGTEHFQQYWEAVGWAQEYARENREQMMAASLRTLAELKGVPPFQARVEAINCHHNYVTKEVHFGEELYITRKGAVRAGQGEMGIIPGSMGAKSFIVRGKGNQDSFNSCSHGAGRVLSRGKAKELISIEDHILATAGVECRKDAGVLDESPKAYKSIEAVMQAQSDLVEIVYTLKQILCIKG
jgi:tRNA-splicing ligase RtcB